MVHQKYDLFAEHKRILGKKNECKETLLSPCGLTQIDVKPVALFCSRITYCCNITLSTIHCLYPARTLSSKTDKIEQSIKNLFCTALNRTTSPLLMQPSSKRFSA